MGLDTLDNYRSEAESERLGLRGMIGRAMTFVGFIVLANAVLIALLFRHLLSFRNQILCAVAGAVIGLIGMVVRGNTRSQLATATIASMTAIAVFVIVSFFEERFGLLALVGIVLVMAFLIQKFEERLWRRL